ncbi:MAG: hypothetical protein QW756_04120 [Nitrososphaerota archaeon]
MVRRYGATRCIGHYAEDGTGKARIIFDVVEKGKTRLLRKTQEVREPRVRHELENAGVNILSSDITEDTYRLRNIGLSIIL